MSKDLQDTHTPRPHFDGPVAAGRSEKTKAKNRPASIAARPRPTVRAQKQARRGDGAGLAVLARVKRRHPTNPKAQVTMFFDEFVLKAGTGRDRPVSERTRSSYVQNLIGMLDELRECNAVVRNLDELGSKHALHLMRLWKLKAFSAGTIEWKLSILRRFLTFIGKGHLIPTGVRLHKWLLENGIEPPPARATVATVSLAWEEKGVDLEQVLPKVAVLCPITAIHLEIQAAFGLRMRESLQLDPRAADYGDVLRVVHGTKGGLPRDVPFDSDPVMRQWQRDVLERAKLMAAKNPKGLLARPGYSLEQNIRHFYHVAERVGITKAGLGVTAHGLRHQYAARRYKEISGLDVPVSAAAPLHITEEVREADLAARTAVSRELGHFRPTVTQAYVGSLSMLERQRGARIRQWVQLTEGNPEFCKALAAAGVSQAWLVGHFAAGAEVAPAEKLRLVVATAQRSPLQEQVGVELRCKLNRIVQRGVALYEYLGQSNPEDDALELKLRIDK
ncbi:integrase domain-containing protein [Curvibacter delicatus]|jgi:integrase|uniref:integrase domain-containing protein n=1 Tax=Curvibacter delicatus TaxID=80879 RepID=UPI0009FD6035|nr:integrase domain-containing protein [Curvibacter delicatus]